MPRRFDSNIITALCTACAMIAYAYYHTYIAVPATAFWVAAAVISLLPVGYRLVSRKACRNRTTTAG